jgi:hypothetical protein
MKLLLVLSVFIMILTNCAKSVENEISFNPSTEIKTVDFSNNSPTAGEVILDYSSEIASRGFSIGNDICLGTIEVSGEGLENAGVIALLKEYVVAGKLKIKLPAGDHTLKFKIKIKKQSGVIENYIATLSIKIIANQKNIIIMIHFTLESLENPTSSSSSLASQSSSSLISSVASSSVATSSTGNSSSAGSVTVIGTIANPIYITLIHKTQGWLITGALFTLKKGTEIILAQTVPGNFFRIDLPIQNEALRSIVTPYAFEITHADYLPLVGTIKVALDGMEINGVELWQFYEYQNFNYYMDPK